jgi:hypothetical protein
MTQPETEHSQTQVSPLNQAQLERLERDKDELSVVSFGIGAAAAFGGVWINPFCLLALSPFAKSLTRLQKISKLLKLCYEILKALDKYNVELYPLLQTDKGQLDLFVRFHEQKEFFAISLKTRNKTKVTFSEKTQSLNMRFNSGGLKKWKPDPLLELGDQEFWLRKNRRDLLGGSSKDARRPIAKVILLYGGLIKLADHADHLYTVMNAQRFLWAKGQRGTVFILEEGQLIPFMQAWLTRDKAEAKAS